MEPTVNPLATIVGRIVPAMFGCIGVAVLIFLWSQPFGEFGSPPLFFRVFGSFIALIFCLVGFGAAIFGNSGAKRITDRALRRRRRTVGDEEEDLPRTGYRCPNCGGGLDRDADVSPKGDVKCTFCDRWFNIHESA